MKTTTKNKDLVVEAVRGLCRALKMPGIASNLDELLRDLDARGADSAEVLETVLSTEVSSREASAVRLRIQEARFPRLFTLEDFDFNTECGVDKARVMALAKGSLVDDKANAIFLGPVGTGKTHLAAALALEAARRRHHVSWFRAADLVMRLIEAKGTRSLSVLERRLSRSSVLVLDELGFVPFDREGAELLFNLLSARHGCASTIITSNLAFSEWTRVFGNDEKLTAAVLDRLAETPSSSRRKVRATEVASADREPTSTWLGWLPTVDVGTRQTPAARRQLLRAGLRRAAGPICDLTVPQ